MSGSKTIYDERLDRQAVDSIDVLLATCARIGLITEDCNRGAWRIIFARYADAQSTKHSRRIIASARVNYD